MLFKNQLATLFITAALGIVGSSSAFAANTHAGSSDPVKMIELGSSGLLYSDNGEGDPILILHDGSTVAETWQPLVKALLSEGRVVVTDLDAAVTNGLVVPDQSLQNLDTLVQALSLEQATVFVHGAVSAVGFDYAVAHPNRVKAIALLGDIVQANDKQPVKNHHKQQNNHDLITQHAEWLAKSNTPALLLHSDADFISGGAESMAIWKGNIDIVRVEEKLIRSGHVDANAAISKKAVSWYRDVQEQWRMLNTLFKL